MPEKFKTASLHQLRRACERHGASFEVDIALGGTVTVDAPSGHVFSCVGTHYVCHHWEDGFPRGEAYADAIEDIEHGFEPCEENDCEYCAEKDCQ